MTIVNEVSVQLPIVLSDDEAAQIAEKLLYRAYTEREQFKFSLSMKYAYLDPGDVVQIDIDGNVHIIRIINIDMALPGLLTITGVADRASIYTSSVTGGAASYPSQTLIVIGDTIFEILDIPALRSADLTTPGYYLAAYGELSSWTGGILYKSTDAGASWSALASKALENTMGTTTTTLADHTPNTWDMVNTVTVSLADGATLSSDTVENVLVNETNRAVIGDEIIAFLNADLVSGNTYALSGLLRGLNGTEWAKSTHTSSDRFVLLESTNIARIESTYSQFGSTVRFKAVSNGQYLDEVTNTTDVTFSNLNARPWSVVKISGERDGSNNLTINWIRRSRAIATPLWNPVLQEDSEEYLVHIMDGTTIKRIFNPTTSSVEYTADQQTLDGFTPGDPITVKIYQVSATVGAGYEAEETV